MQMPAEAAVQSSQTEIKRIAVLGASGYTGEEVVRLLAQHPNFKVTSLTGESQAGKVRIVPPQCLKPQTSSMFQC